MPIVEWYENDTVVKVNVFLSMDRSLSFLVVQTFKSHTAVYTCKGTNYIGNMKYTSSANVTVIVKD